MNRIILEESERIGDSLFCLNNRKSNHILKTLKSQIGDKLKAGLLNQSIGTTIIQSIDYENRKVKVIYQEENTNYPLTNLTNIRVFSSIQRPQTVKKMIQLSATCGVSELFFFPADKSEFSYLNSSIWSEKSILEEVILGLEQGGRIKQPQVLVLKNKYKIKDHLTLGDRIVLDFNAKSLLDHKVEYNIDKPLQIAIGPESGFTEEDLIFFTGLNFEKISVSENILRSELAFAFVLSQLELLKSPST